MANTMAQVMGAGGDKPQDNPDPSQPQPSLSSILGNPGQVSPMPQASPVPQPSAAPQDPSHGLPNSTPVPQPQPNGPKTAQQKLAEQDKAVDDLITDKEQKAIDAAFGGPEKSQELVDGHLPWDMSDIRKNMGNSAAKDFNQVERFDPNESPKDLIKHIASNARANLQLNPEAQLTVAQSMYGEKNAWRDENGKIKYRKTPQSQPRDFDSSEMISGGTLEPILEHSLSSIPGLMNFVANAMTQRATGYPELAGATGGLTDSLTNTGLIAATDAFSDKKTFDGKEALKDAITKTGLGWVAGLASIPLAYAPSAITSATKSFLGAVFPDTIETMAQLSGAAAEKKGGALATMLVKVPMLFNNLREAMYGPLEEGAAETNAKLADMYTRHVDDLNKNVGISRRRVITLAGDQKFAPATNFLERSQEELEKVGFRFDENGRLHSDYSGVGTVRGVGDSASVPQSTSSVKTIGSGQSESFGAVQKNDMGGLVNQSPRETVVTGGQPEAAAVPNYGRPQLSVTSGDQIMSQDLAASGIHDANDQTYYKKLALLHEEMYSATNGVSGGVGAKRIFSAINQMDHDMSSSKMEDRVFGQYAAARNALAGDRNIFARSVLEGSGTPEELTVAQAFKDFHDKIDGSASITKAMQDPAFRKEFVLRMTKGASNRISAQVNNVKTMFGEGSEEWKLFKNQAMDEIINNHIDPTTKVLNTEKMNSFLFLNQNRGYRDALLPPAEQADWNRYLGMANSIDYKGLTNDGEKTILLKMVSAIASRRVGSAATVPTELGEALLKLVKQNANTVRWLQNDGFREAIEAAEGPAQREAIMQLQQGTRAITSRLNILEVPTQAQNKVMAIRRYMPMIGTGLSESVGQALQKKSQSDN